MITNEYTSIFDWLQTCPYLSNLWKIIGEEAGSYNQNSNIIFPSGASRQYSIEAKPDVNGEIEFTMRPAYYIAKEFPLQFYAMAQKDDTPGGLNFNVVRLNEVQSVIDWIIEQNNIGNLPIVNNKQVLGVEVNPSVPQLYGISSEDDGITIKYGCTLFVYFANTALRRDVVYGE